ATPSGWTRHARRKTPAPAAAVEAHRPPRPTSGALMKPLDPRLLRHARAARRHVLLTAGLGGLTAALVVGQALVIAQAVAPVVRGEAGWDGIQRGVVALLGLLLLRGLLAWAQERYA